MMMGVSFGSGTSSPRMSTEEFMKLVKKYRDNGGAYRETLTESLQTHRNDVSKIYYTFYAVSNELLLDTIKLELTKVILEDIDKSTENKKLYLDKCKIIFKNIYNIVTGVSTASFLTRRVRSAVRYIDFRGLPQLMIDIIDVFYENLQKHNFNLDFVSYLKTTWNITAYSYEKGASSRSSTAPDPVIGQVVEVSSTRKSAV